MTTTATTSKDFKFPFQPYDIQKKFMQELYATIDQGKIGVFESPTGTGKSLSIICSCLTWLLDQAKVNVQDDEEKSKKRSRKDDDEPDWVKAYDPEKEEKEAMAQHDEQRQAKRQKRVHHLNAKQEQLLGTSKIATTVKAAISTKSGDDADELVLKDYDSGSESSTKPTLNAALLADLYDSDDEQKRLFKDDDDDGNTDTFYTPKIIYASRTHSQLSQFVKELKRTQFAPLVRVVSLASRGIMCVHPKVSKLKSVERMNEVCIEMKNNKKTKCQFHDLSAQKIFKDHVLVKVREIEELVSLGRRIESCPYYGTRRAVPHAQVVIVPYASLIHKKTRESLGITQLKDCIVVIDEAHNLVDAISNTYSVQLTAQQVNQVSAQLTKYFTKYQTRLKPKNQGRVKQVLAILKYFLQFLKFSEQPSQQPTKEQETKQQLMSINDFLFATKIDNINLYQVVDFMEKSELTKKLNGFIDKCFQEDKQSNVQNSPENVQSGVYNFMAFLTALMNLNKDGRVLVQWNDSKSSSNSLRFILLNTEVYFKDIVQEARAVILAGGTMEPVCILFTNFNKISSMIQQLCPKQEHRIKIFQCDHVIPDDHLLPLIVSKGPSGMDLEFNYQSRAKNANGLMDELGKVVLDICNRVPDGVICFFPSYSYEEEVYQYWEKTGVVQKLEQLKKFFREPKQANQVEETLIQYKRIINNNFAAPDKEYYFKGAILSSVIGGKMSEVGLPYPNKNDPVLKEKIQSLDAKHGAEYATNICMKGVNQSIGRCIRHAQDYASIVLLDKRYEQAGIKGKLPGWVKRRLVTTSSFSQAQQQLTSFFAGKQSLQEQFEQERSKIK